MQELPRDGVVLAIDAMGADGGPAAIVEGCARARDDGLKASLRLFGRADDIAGPMAEFGLTGAEVVHTDGVITMDDKPSRAVRRGRDSSMWGAIAAVKDKTAQACVSSGNTGALMAMSMLQLRMIEGVNRPAIAALWPTMRGRTVVLDVGANVELDADQYVQFAIMGEAYFAALTGKEQPTVGILNVGEEEEKGHSLVRQAARTLRLADPEMDFQGFVEGDDISAGAVDVVVTDGFTGNVALKAAEGTARMIGSWIKTALTADMRSKAGALLLAPSLREMKSKMNPSQSNGAPLLGLDGLVLKSHGGADAEGVAAAVKMAEELAVHPFLGHVRRTIAEVSQRVAETPEIVEMSE